MPGQEQLKVINFASPQYRSPPRPISGAANGVSAKQHKGPKVCGTCLGDHSDHTNEIVECDGCGVTTHEACYGIQVGKDIDELLQDIDELLQDFSNLSPDTTHQTHNSQESGSLYSNTGSEASTEPWFCEPCMAGVKSPHCEVCPRYSISTSTFTHSLFKSLTTSLTSTSTHK